MKDEDTYQLLKHTIVQLHFRSTTLPELVVVVLQTFPVSGELLEAMGVDVLDPGLPCSLVCVLLLVQSGG